MERWQFGDIVVLRHAETPTSARLVHAHMGDPAGIGPDNHPFLSNGQIITVQARPYLVIEHTNDVIALFQPEGTPLPRWDINEERYLETLQRSRGESLRLLFPGHNYDATLFFETANEPPWFMQAFERKGLTAGWRRRRRASGVDPVLPDGTPGRFRGWFVNLQSSPVFRTYGFDVVDHTLDIVVRPDLSWYWKDEDELQTALDVAAITPDQAAEIRCAGDEVVKLIESRSMPFDDRWTRWHRSEHPGWDAIEYFPDGWQTEPPMLPGDGLNPYTVTPR
jgi:hypothetical protein